GTEGGEHARQTESIERELDGPGAVGGLRADDERATHGPTGKVCAQVGHTQCPVDEAARELEVTGPQRASLELRNRDPCLHPRRVPGALEPRVAGGEPRERPGEARPPTDRPERQLAVQGHAHLGTCGGLRQTAGEADLVALPPET